MISQARHLSIQLQNLSGHSLQEILFFSWIATHVSFEGFRYFRNEIILKSSYFYPSTGMNRVEQIASMVLHTTYFHSKNRAHGKAVFLPLSLQILSKQAPSLNIILLQHWISWTRGKYNCKAINSCYQTTKLAKNHRKKKKKHTPEKTRNFTDTLWHLPIKNTDAEHHKFLYWVRTKVFRTTIH